MNFSVIVEFDDKKWYYPACEAAQIEAAEWKAYHEEVIAILAVALSAADNRMKHGYERCKEMDNNHEFKFFKDNIADLLRILELQKKFVLKIER